MTNKQPEDMKTREWGPGFDDKFKCNCPQEVGVHYSLDMDGKEVKTFIKKVEDTTRKETLREVEEGFVVSENMIMWAFRYALGRRTGAVDSVVRHLKMHWKNLRPFTQNQIQQEIRTAVEMGHAGSDCDMESWKEITTLLNQV